MVVKVIHRLPGRLRLEITGLRWNRALAARLKKELQEFPKLKACEVNARTGRILVYGETSLDEQAFVAYLARLAAEVPLPAGREDCPQPVLGLPVQAALTAASGGMLLLLSLLRLVRGPGRRARSETLYTLHAVAAVLAGYPVFAGAVRGLAGRRRLSGDLLLSLALLGTLTARDSLLGLTVATLANLNGLLLAREEREAKLAMAEMPARQTAHSDGTERADAYARRVLPLALGLSGISYLMSGSLLSSLSLLILGCPCAVYLAEAAVRRMALREARDHGILERERGALIQAGSADVVLVDQSVLIGGEYAAPTAILQPGAKEVVSALRRAGVPRLVLVTSADEQEARTVGEAVGIPEVYAGLDPVDKAALVQRLQADGFRVVYVGSDEEAETVFAQADVGLALLNPDKPSPAGAALLLPGEDLGRLPTAVGCGARLAATLRQNYNLAAGLSLGTMALALAGLLDPFAAAAAHNLVTLSVLINTARRHPVSRRGRPVRQHRREQSAGAAAVAAAAAPMPVAASNLLTQMPWWRFDEADLARQLGTDLERGLSSAEALRRLQVIGPNRLRELPPPSVFTVAVKQLTNSMLLILLAAAAAARLLGQRSEALTILAIVLLDVLLGSWQEYRAEQAIHALRDLTAPQARVLRDGEEREIPADGLVPGDIILLAAGDRVSADARLLDAAGLEIEEATLTGESVPVLKKTLLEAENDDPRQVLIFLGTSVTRGRGRAVVTATGMGTELGRVASLIQTVEEDTVPLERLLQGLGRQLVTACFALSALVVAVGVWRGQPLRDLVLAGLSLAVGAIPEGLPAFVTISLALGVRRMIAKHAIVRRLPAVETLGCATVICSDKTGTLTMGAMTVRRVFVAGRWVQVSGEGYRPEGSFTWEGCEPTSRDEEALLLILAAGVLASDARLLPAAEPGWEYEVAGDPTEGALLVAAVKAGLDPDELAAWARRVAERPFESQRRSMTVLLEDGNGRAFACVKGAPEVLLGQAGYVLRQGELLPVTDALRSELAQAESEMTAQALRVLALGFKPLDGDVVSFDPLPDDLEAGLILLGLVGMVDPLRPEVKSAVLRCRQAGVKTVLVTGDHPDTARAVAGELGMWERDSLVLTGPELEELSDEELVRFLPRIVIFARALPQHKVRIVRAFKASGYVVAMTGDGVNDAPAVKEADIGITMGKSGTEVTKEASCLILTDDNFATIVRAIEEGRATYENIRRFIRYVLTGSLAQVVLMLISTTLNLPLPLTPTQILWVNMVTEGFPALALGADAPDDTVMRRRPRSPHEGLLDAGLGLSIIGRGLTTSLATAGVFIYCLEQHGNLRRARTTAFASLAASQLIYVYECRLEGRQLGTSLGKSYLAPAVLTSAALLLAAIYTPGLAGVFATQPLGLWDWSLALLPGSVHLLLPPKVKAGQYSKGAVPN